MLKKRKVPHTYVIIFLIIVFSAVLTWIIPGGIYVEEVVEGTKTVKFQEVDNVPQTWQIFAALFKGFKKQADIIVFILMIGGAFWIMNESKSIDVGIFSFLRFTKRLERLKFFRSIGVENIVISLIMLLFSVFGAVSG